MAKTQLLKYQMQMDKTLMQTNTEMLKTCQRRFSLFTQPNNKEPGKGKNDYEDSFEDLLREGTVSKEQQEEFERRRSEKAESVKLEQERQEKARQESHAKKEKDFDAFVSGKSEITDDMTLQDIFKQFYSKAKQSDISGNIKNSAMSSLNGFSSRLERRRQAAREKKDGAQAGEKAEARGKAEEQAAEESTHKFEAAKTN